MPSTQKPLESHGGPRPFADFHVFVLSSLAIAQPMLDLIGRQPQFLVAHRAGRLEILVLAACLLLVVPALLVLPGRLLGAVRPHWRRPWQGAVMVFLAALLALQIVNRLAPGLGSLSFLLSLGVGLAFVLLNDRRPALRTLVSFLGIALLAVPTAFFTRPSILGLIRGGKTQDVGLRIDAEVPVFLLIFDELALTTLLDGERRIDRELFPHFAAFADRATWFEGAVTVSDSTHLAVPAILSGRFPEIGKLPTVQEHPQNLFTLLGDSYEIWADEPITLLCPPELNRRGDAGASSDAGLARLLLDSAVVYLHLVLPEPQRQRLPSIDDAWGGFTAASGNAEADTELEPKDAEAASLAKRKAFANAARTAAKSDRTEIFDRFLKHVGPEVRALHMLHLLLPHAPWSYLPSGRSYSRTQTPGLQGKVWSQDEDLVARAYQRYLLQTAYLDRLLGRLIDHLEALGLYDQALIVLTSDHGSSFLAGDNRRVLTTTNAHDILPQLLLIKRPGQTTAEVRHEPASALEILPTILDVLGAEAPEPLPGRSLFSPEYAGPARAQALVTGKRTLDWPLELAETKYQTLRWKLELFGGGEVGDSFRLGEAPHLHGLEVAELPIEAAPSLRVQIDGEEGLRRFAPDSTLSPSRLTGVLESATPLDGRGPVLALSVNGIVRATPRAFGLSRRQKQLAALLPESALLPGANRVEVFIVEGEGSSTRLLRPRSERIEAGALTFSEDGRVKALNLEGQRVPIEPGRLRGTLNAFDRRGDRRMFAGWAIDHRRRTLPHSILVFNDERLVATVTTSEKRPEIARRYKDPSLERSGFRLEMVSGSLVDLENNGVQAFALSRDRATASRLTPHYRLEAEAGRERLSVTDGRQLTIEPAAAGETWEVVRQEEKRTVLRVHLRQRQTSIAPWLAVFAGDKFLTEARPPFQPADRADDPANAWRKGRFALQATTLGGRNLSSLRIFVLESGRAQELSPSEQP